MKKVVIIGGGAAGFFAANELLGGCLQNSISVTILEKSNKILSKVKVSGGGRCNVTNSTKEISKLVACYPRGQKELKKVFKKFATVETINWFQDRGVELKTEEDGRVFPKSDSSQTIIDCLLQPVKFGILEIVLNAEVKLIEKNNRSFIVKTESAFFHADYIIVTSGGYYKPQGYSYLKHLGHTIIDPVPSLFTFNIKDHPLKSLMGVSVKESKVRIMGTDLQYSGPILITHWGFSGPAVLKLSAFGALYLHKAAYKNGILINWVNARDEDEVRAKINECIVQKSTSFPHLTNFYRLPDRLWKYLLIKSEIELNKNWSEQGKKSINKLVNAIFLDTYEINGKTTFKEEFVTCGGINLDDVEFETMESKLVTGLYFAGEVLDIDGITGGFNFQAAWSTAWVAARSIQNK